MSPSPMAPSSASVRACSPTSASECPSRPWVCAILTPHSQTWSPAAKRCTSKPWPVRTSAGPASGVLNHGQVLRRRELAVGFAAVDQRHRQPGPFGDGRVVGQIVAAGRGRGFVGGQNVREAKALRGLRPPKPGTPDGRGNASPGIRPLQGVGKRDRGDGARRVLQEPRSTRSMMSAVTNGRTPSWISTRSGACGASARRPLSTERCRVSPPVAGGVSLGCPEGDGCVVQRAVVRPDHDRHQVDVRRSEKNAHGPRQDGARPRGCILLGRGGPGARAPSGGDDQGGCLQGASRLARPA